jgi:DNA cross-link repair 1A protein
MFPAQAQVISACAELAKRLVSGQGIAAAEDDKGTVSNWLTLIPKSETKACAKPANTLILVGYVASCSNGHVHEKLNLNITWE